MIINSPRSVTLTEREGKARRAFQLLLDQGHDILTAAARTQETHPGLDPAFYRYLRDEPLMSEPSEDA